MDILKPFAPALARFEARPTDERDVMRNRLALSCLALVVAIVAQVEGEEARAFLRASLPIVLLYLLGAAAFMAHMAWRPTVSRARLGLALTMDALMITTAMVLGGGAAAWLLPLYFWMILGAGARLGAGFLVYTVALSLFGFAMVVAATPFWRDHLALSISLLLSLAVLPLHGAILLRHIAEARARAENANRAKTLFLASVSHELRTPLTAIIGLTGLLQHSRLDAEQREMARTLQDSAQTLLRQIEHLLSGAREEIGQEEGGDEAVDFVALLVSLRAMLAVEAQAKGVRLGLMIEADTPNHIVCDRRRVQEIFQNVVGNAVKFTREGAVAVRVGAARREDEVWVTVEVRDTGPGIPAEARQRIFEPFRQGDASIGAKFGGAGLGLSIVKRRLAAMGGDIAVENPDAGALFRLRWPVTPVDPVEEDAEGSDPEGAAPEKSDAEPVCVAVTDDFDALAVAARHDLAVLVHPFAEPRARKMARRLAALRRAPGQPIKILLAEDNAVNSRILEKILCEAGHEVKVVADGEAALLAMLSDSFDVVVLDVNMPRLRGIETARIYASARPRGRAPVLALTADDSAESRKLCRAAGMVDCLRKPIAPEVLHAAIEAAAAVTPRPPRENARCDKLDPATLSALDRLGGTDFVRGLLVQFAADAAYLIEDIHASFARGDVASLGRQAHALESMAGNMGAAALARLCRGWRTMTEKRLALSAERESERLRRRWRLTQDALGRALAQM